jgi:DNA (cytosine-5)-methyltransferase 1
LDLFSGIGGFSLGLDRTGGFETVAFCEIEEFPRKVLRKHWPEVPIYEDVRTLTADILGRDGIRPNVIVGGFPCQDISVAGKGAGLGGKQSSLWREYARLISEIRPQYVIVENVAALLARGMGNVLGDLAACGYDAVWDCIPASFVGAPHNRDRLWIVAYPERDKQSRAKPCVWPLGRVGWFEQPVSWDRHWKDALSELRRLDDGFPRSVASTDGYRNAVVPQIPEMIGRAIMQAEAQHAQS